MHDIYSVTLHCQIHGKDCRQRYMYICYPDLLSFSMCCCSGTLGAVTMRNNVMHIWVPPHSKQIELYLILPIAACSYLSIILRQTAMVCNWGHDMGSAIYRFVAKCRCDECAGDLYAWDSHAGRHAECRVSSQLSRTGYLEDIIFAILQIDIQGIFIAFVPLSKTKLWKCL